MWRRRRRRETVDGSEGSKRVASTLSAATTTAAATVLGRLNRALNLNSEKHVAYHDDTTWTKLRLLNSLLTLDLETEENRRFFDENMLELVHSNPDLAKVRFKSDGYEEYLLHQIICKKPSIELVAYVYNINPVAAEVPGFGDFFVIHNACWGHASLEVIKFLVDCDPKLIKSRPFPPLFCAIDDETSIDVLQYLVSTYPDALRTCDVSSVTPVDLALKKQLPIAVLKLFLDHYPSPELKINENAGLREVREDVATLFGSNHKGLQTLDATFLHFSAEGQSAFFDALSSNKTLTELAVNLTEIREDEKVCGSLKHFLQSNTVLSRLLLTGGKLDPLVALLVVSGLSRNTTIRELTIENGLDAMGIEELLKATVEAGTLRKLSLKNSVVPDASWSCVASLVKLEVLDLFGCRIGTSLVEPICGLLSASSSIIVELFVGQNDIGDDGTVEIAEVLQSNTTLKKLGYERNGTGERGWEAFLKAMTNHNKALQSMKFSREEALYEKFYPQIEYLCDQNKFRGSTVIATSISPLIESR